MKEIIKKSKIKSSCLLEKLAINIIDISSKSQIAGVFNDYLINFGTNLFREIIKT